MTAGAASTRDVYTVNARQVAWTNMNGCPDALQIVGTKIGERSYVICGHFISGGVHALTLMIRGTGTTIGVPRRAED